MRIARWIPYTLSVVIIACVGAAVCHMPSHAKSADASPAPAATTENVLDHVGVVDVDRLVRANPDSRRLEQIEQEIAYVQAQIDMSGPSQEDLLKDAHQQLDAARKKLMEKLNADVTRMKAELDARKAGVESALRSEAASMADQMKAYEEELKRKANGGQITVQPEPDTRKKLNADLADYAQKLMVAAQSQLAARTLELQSQVSTNMNDQRRKMEARLAEQMDAVMKADQAEKIQLRLNMQTVADEDGRKKIQDKLGAIDDREEKKRQEIRGQLAAEFESENKAEQDKIKAEVKDYKAKLDAEVRQKILAHQGQMVSKYGVAGPTRVNDLRKALETKQNELKARFEAKKAELVGGLQASSRDAEAHIKQEEKDLAQTLKKEQQRILHDIVKTQGRVSKDEQARRDRLKNQLTELKTQRDRVYEGIVAQIRASVAKLAQQQQVPLVVGGYRVNISCKDLTDAVLQAGANNAAAPSGQ